MIRKTSLLEILAFFGAALALDDVAAPFTFVDSAIIEASEFNANFDTLEGAHNRLIDSLDLRFPRWSSLLAGDSTFSRITVDSLTGLNVMSGNPTIDSASIGELAVTTNATGITLNMVEDLTGNKTFTMDDKTLRFNFTNPNGGILFNWQGNATGHLFELIQQVGNPSGGGNHLLHVEASDADVLPGHFVHNNPGDTALKIEGQTIGTHGASFTTLNTGHGANELYAMDQNVRTTDAVTFTTVNTGQGANELYAMDQNVTTTSDVNFDSLDVRVAVVDSLAFARNSILYFGIGKVNIDTLLATHGTIDSMDVLGHVDADSVDVRGLLAAKGTITDLTANQLNYGAVLYDSVATNSLAYSRSLTYLLNENEVALDTLASITGGSIGDVLQIVYFDNSSSLLIQNSSDIRLEGGLDVTLDAQFDAISFVYFGTNIWVETSRSLK